MEAKTGFTSINGPVGREGQAGGDGNGDNNNPHTQVDGTPALTSKRVQACDRCYSRKIGCDRVLPTCGNCKTAHRQCLRLQRSYETKERIKERLRQAEAEARKLKESNDAKDRRIMELESIIRGPFSLIKSPSSSSSRRRSSTVIPVVRPHNHTGALPDNTNLNLERQQQRQLEANLAPHDHTQPYPSYPSHLQHHRRQEHGYNRHMLPAPTVPMIQVSSSGDTNANIVNSEGLVTMQGPGVTSPVVASGEGAVAVDGDGGSRR
ncbi:hypothetical protein FQN50_005515 [Emmonsiellopsis sp. PD_5]|nr:hypothetical protein FQN50_005515 [Emmonsiellopsis sp. PD_5]